MTAATKPQSYALLRLSDIAPGPNARQKFPKLELEELGRSLAGGQAQPIVVRPHPGIPSHAHRLYELVAGERRVRAAALAGMEMIEAVVRDMDDAEAARIRLVENIDRKDLTALEQAMAVQMCLIQVGAGVTREEVSRLLGHDASWIANMLLLLKLPKRAKDLLADGTFTAKHGRELVRLQAKAGDERVADLLEAVGWQLEECNVPTARAFADLVDDEIETYAVEQERDRRDEEALQRETAARVAKEKLEKEKAKHAKAVAAAKKKGDPPPREPDTLKAIWESARASAKAEVDAKQAKLSDRERESREAATRSAQRTRVRKKLIAESAGEYTLAVLERRLVPVHWRGVKPRRPGARRRVREESGGAAP